MTVTLNNAINEATPLVVLSDIPNIVKVEDVQLFQDITPEFVLSCNTTSMANQYDGRYTIELFGESVSSVRYPENAYNRNFYIHSTNNESTAASIANALRNCPSLFANYYIENAGATIKLTGRRQFETDIQSNYFTNDKETNQSISINYLKLSSYHDGQNPCQLTDSRVSLDIYKDYDEKYVTTLQKVCNGTEVSFNISPVLTSLAKEGKAIEFAYRPAYIATNGRYYTIGNPDDFHNYIVQGYMVNQGLGKGFLRQIDATTPMVMENYSRGNANTEFDNHTILYTFEPSIPLTIIRGEEISGETTITYRDSAFEVLGTYETEWSALNTDMNLMQDITIPLTYGPETLGYWNNSFYVDIEIIGAKIRYNVIKPLKMAEQNTRIFFRNSYGGVSFIDMTGQKEETRELETKTYRKNIYDYHQLDKPNALDILYDNDVTYTVRVKSHLFEEDGKYIYNDLLQSPRAWITVNNQVYDIIIQSVSVEELNDQNNIYEATITFVYSEQPSLL